MQILHELIQKEKKNTGPRIFFFDQIWLKSLQQPSNDLLKIHIFMGMVWCLPDRPNRPLPDALTAARSVSRSRRSAAARDNTY